MPRPRTPKAKAEVSGASQVNPGRFAERVSPKGMRPIGEPYLKMTDSQKEAWAEFVSELPWLDSSHRQLLRVACIFVAKMDENPEFGVSAAQTLSSILSKLGATPVDATKIIYDGGSTEEPEDKFFGRPN